jgi:DNA-binding beta-propeller fold protein YncE
MHTFILSSVCSLLFAACLVFSTPHKLLAQLEGLPVTYLDSITEDEEGNALSFPSSVFVDPVKNEIYVIDSKTRVIIYTADFFPLFTVGKRNGIENPQGLTVDAAGTMYVAQGATKQNPGNKISVFNACLKWSRDIYFRDFEGADSFMPSRLALDKKGNIYVAGTYYPGVLILSNRGQLLEILSPDEDDRKVHINYVTIDESGKIYLVSEESSHIYVYDENRKFLFKFGEKGGSTGKLSRPLAVAIDNRNGRIYVVDYMRHTVSVYDREGKYLFEFGGLGYGEGWFQYPRDIAVDPTGRIFVADTFNNRIEIFQSRE